MKKFIVGKKIGMTQLFKEDGTVVPVTIVSTPSCIITQVKTKDHDGYDAIQVAYGVRKVKNINKPQRGHYKELGNFSGAKEFRLDDVSSYRVGDKVMIDQFAEGDKVQAQGISRGLGFQGVVKRHHFHGHPVSHGHKDQERHSGSIGAGGVQKVFKGIRMGGQMGSALFTVKNLVVAKVDADNSQLYLRGAVPGPRNKMLRIYA